LKDEPTPASKILILLFYMIAECPKFGFGKAGAPKSLSTLEYFLQDKKRKA
jgi:hypothetical protein